MSEPQGDDQEKRFLKAPQQLRCMLRLMAMLTAHFSTMSPTCRSPMAALQQRADVHTTLISQSCSAPPSCSWSY